MRRGIWFLAGAGAGAWTVVRARRTAEAFTPDGLRDRLSAAGLGVRLFGEEIRAGMIEKETELRDRLALSLDGPPELASGVGTAASRPPRPPSELTGPHETPHETERDRT